MDIYVRLDEKRLLTLKEFCQYSSMGRNAALKFIREHHLNISENNRFLIDRIAFDRWCEERQEENNERSKRIDTKVKRIFSS